jgi:CRISPR/Cas system CMR subunit Cmr4 (Cas7 group RAMP superfamily)
MTDPPSNPSLCIARVTIEVASPLSIGSGDGGGVFDVAIARDANGFPMINGASLQGVLRSLMERSDRGKADWLFGTMQARTTSPAKITVNAAMVHNANDCAVVGLILDGSDLSDALLPKLRDEDPVLRDHVRINEMGAADGSGKFDRAAVPRGTRFSFELSMWCSSAEEISAFKEVLALVPHPLFRLGGATRRGYGRIKVLAMAMAKFATPAEQADDICKLRSKPLSYQRDLQPVDTSHDDWADVIDIAIDLTTCGYWRAGNDGTAVRTDSQQGIEQANRHREVDAAFTREPWIDWASGKGTWQEPGSSEAQDYVLAGSSIRGALAHRALFHWNKICGNFVDAESPNAAEQLKAFMRRRNGLEIFLGVEKTDRTGTRSALIVDDHVFKPVNIHIADHNSIDRFTGGVRNGVLFSEELVHSGDITVRLIIDNKVAVDAGARAALCAAVKDLCEGKLSLGAKSQGWFELANKSDWPRIETLLTQEKSA